MHMQEWAENSGTRFMLIKRNTNINNGLIVKDACKVRTGFALNFSRFMSIKGNMYLRNAHVV